MPLLQIRDVPEEIYRRLADEADRDRRSLAQQAVAVLARGLQADLDAKGRRRAVLQTLRSASMPRPGRLTDPAKLIAQDRRR